MNTTPSNICSTAHIKIPPLSPTEIERDVDVDFDALRALLFACGPKANKNDQVDVLIAALTGTGITSGARILGIIKALGFDKQHAGIRLTAHARNHPDKRQWYCDTQGRYRAVVQA